MVCITGFDPALTFAAGSTTSDPWRERSGRTGVNNGERSFL
jgi:hypothetical protein